MYSLLFTILKQGKDGKQISISNLVKVTGKKRTHAPEEASSSVGETLEEWQNERNSRKCTETKTFHYYMLSSSALRHFITIQANASFYSINKDLGIRFLITYRC